MEIEDKAKLDGIYAKALKNSSLSGFLMDMKMFFGSVLSVLKSEGVVEGGTGTIVKELEKAKSSNDNIEDIDYMDDVDYIDDKEDSAEV